MNVGELFVNLGVKGADSSGKAIKGIGEGLKGVKSTSLEAKAAILGLMYGFERLMSASGQMGTNMQNFNALTGVSARDLQQWQYAMRQAGGSADEATTSIKAVQNAMEMVNIGKDVPAGLARIGQLTGGVSPKEAREAAENPMAMMRRLREYAEKEQDIALRNINLKSMGLSETMIAGLTRGKFDDKNLNRAPLVSDKEIKNLVAVDVAWTNLGMKIQRAMDHFTAKHGMSITDDISRITDKVILLAEAFTRLLEKVQAFKAVGNLFEGWAKMMDMMAGKSDLSGNKVDENKSKAEKTKDFFLQSFEAWKGLQIQTQEDLAAGVKENKKDYEKDIAPRVGFTNSPVPVQNTELNLTLNFQHDGTDIKKTSDSVTRAVKDAYRQMNAQTRGN